MMIAYFTKTMTVLYILFPGEVIERNIKELRIRVGNYFRFFLENVECGASQRQFLKA